MAVVGVDESTFCLARGAASGEMELPKPVNLFADKTGVIDRMFIVGGYL